MADKFTFRSAGEIQDVEFALARNGWTHPLVKKATAGNFFGLVLEALEGRAEIVRIDRLTTAGAAQYVIDCDAKPFIPNGFMVAPDSEQLPGRVRGQFVFEKEQTRLYLSKCQQNGKHIVGSKLRAELKNKPVLPANVLDFFIANQRLIPEEWKGLVVFFWGTIYRDADGDLYVRFLSFFDGAWRSYDRWLDFDWRGYDPAALRAS